MPVAALNPDAPALIIEPNHLVGTVTDTDWEATEVTLNADWSPRIRQPKDWEPLRALAQTRARVTLKQVWEHETEDRRIYHAQFHRFCYRDYGPTLLSIIETPTGLSISQSEREKGETQRRQKAHYCISFKGGRIAFYSRRKVSATVAHVRHALPFTLNVTSPIKTPYPEAKKRFSRRLIRMLRSKARANGARLPAGDYDDLPTLLTDALFPALKAVKAQHLALKGVEWTVGESDRWLLRHMRCPVAELPKRMTGYGSKVVTRLFWEAMRPPPPRVNEHGQFTELPDRRWQHKWSWLALLRTWMPVDFAQQVLRAERIAPWEDSFSKDPAKVRRFLKQWEPRRVVRMLTETAADGFTIRDTLQMMEERTRGGGMPDRRFRDVVEMHEWFIAERNRENEQRRLTWAREAERREAERLAAMTPEARAAMEIQHAEQRAREERERAEEMLPLPVEYGKAVDGRLVFTPDGKIHQIVTPKTADELNAWGNGMHNCIGSYARSIRYNGCQIFGVRSGAEFDPAHPVQWGIDVRDGEIRQFRGTCNEDAPPDLRAAVAATLLEAELIGGMDVDESLRILRAAAPVEAGQLVGVNADGDIHPF
jgi:hypothetical protein